jgi:cell division protein ZapA
MGQVAVTINGRTFRFACGDGQEARVSELSAYIQGKLNALGHDLGRIGDERLLVMAALLIADELFEARENQAPNVADLPVRHDRPHRHSDELRASLPPKPRQRKVSANTAGLKTVEQEPLIIAPDTEPSSGTNEG